MSSLGDTGFCLQSDSTQEHVSGGRVTCDTMAGVPGLVGCLSTAPSPAQPPA